MRAELVRVSAQPRFEAARSQRVIATMKEAYRRKETEFELLMDVKISLAQDIKTLRDLLADEERRLGIVVEEPVGGAASASSASTTVTTSIRSHESSSSSSSSSSRVSASMLTASLESNESSSSRKKRKTSGDKQQASASSSSSSSSGGLLSMFGSSSAPAADAIIISQIDLEGYYVRLRNTSTDEVSLDGWALTNESQSFRYDFGADQTLRSGESLTLWCGTPDEYAALQRILRESSTTAAIDGGDSSSALSSTLRRALTASQSADAATQNDLVWGVENAQLFDQAGDSLSLWSPAQRCVDVKAVIPSGAGGLLHSAASTAAGANPSADGAAKARGGCAVM